MFRDPAFCLAGGERRVQGTCGTNFFLFFTPLFLLLVISRALVGLESEHELASAPATPAWYFASMGTRSEERFRIVTRMISTWCAHAQRFPTLRAQQLNIWCSLEVNTDRAFAYMRPLKRIRRPKALLVEHARECVVRGSLRRRRRRRRRLSIPL